MAWKADKFTRDLYLCWETFCDYYPEKKPEMKTVLEYAVNPPTDKQNVIAQIDTFGRWVAAEDKRVFERG